jgi:hypothetical protein
MVAWRANPLMPVALDVVNRPAAPLAIPPVLRSQNHGRPATRTALCWAAVIKAPLRSTGEPEGCHATAFSSTACSKLERMSWAVLLIRSADFSNWPESFAHVAMYPKLYSLESVPSVLVTT